MPKPRAWPTATGAGCQKGGNQANEKGVFHLSDHLFCLIRSAGRMLRIVRVLSSTGAQSANRFTNAYRRNAQENRENRQNRSGRHPRRLLPILPSFPPATRHPVTADSLRLCSPPLCASICSGRTGYLTSGGAFRPERVLFWRDPSGRNDDRLGSGVPRRPTEGYLPSG